jgi:hypothetical protein
MVESKLQFNNRLRLLGRKHSKMANGYTTQLRNDGLIVVKPRRASRRGFPLKGIVLMVLGLFCFKALILASLGPDGYGERVAKLQEGTVVERGGAWVMQADPATQVLANLMGPVMR